MTGDYICFRSPFMSTHSPVRTRNFNIEDAFVHNEHSIMQIIHPCSQFCALFSCVDEEDEEMEEITTFLLSLFLLYTFNIKHAHARYRFACVFLDILVVLQEIQLFFGFHSDFFFVLIRLVIWFRL